MAYHRWTLKPPGCSLRLGSHSGDNIIFEVILPLHWLPNDGKLFIASSFSLHIVNQTSGLSKHIHDEYPLGFDGRDTSTSVDAVIELPLISGAGRSWILRLLSGQFFLGRLRNSVSSCCRFASPKEYSSAKLSDDFTSLQRSAFGSYRIVVCDKKAINNLNVKQYSRLIYSCFLINFWFHFDACSPSQPTWIFFQMAVSPPNYFCKSRNSSSVRHIAALIKAEIRCTETTLAIQHLNSNKNRFLRQNFWLFCGRKKEHAKTPLDVESISRAFIHPSTYTAIIFGQCDNKIGTSFSEKRFFTFSAPLKLA